MMFLSEFFSEISWEAFDADSEWSMKGAKFTDVVWAYLRYLILSPFLSHIFRTDDD